MHELIGQDRDEQVAVDPRLGAVVDRAQAQFGLEGLDTASKSVSMVKSATGAQRPRSIHLYTGSIPRDGSQGPGDRLRFPADCRGEFARGIRKDLNGIVLTYPVTLDLQAPDALSKLVNLLDGPWPRQAIMQRLQGGFEALGKSLGDPLLLTVTAFEETVQPQLLTVDVTHPLDGQRITTGRRQRCGCGGIELALALAADHQIAVTLGAQPQDVLRPCDPGVHNIQGAARCPNTRSISSRVVLWLTAPSKVWERRTIPLSCTNPNVTSGQSLRFSFECPRRAFGLPASAPSKKVLVRS